LKRLTIAVRPALSALAIGGQTASTRGADKATARDARGRLVVPASALRGALRIELERLLRGRDGDLAVCSANRAVSAGTAAPCGCAVCRLFGEETGATGTLRLEDAIWAGDDPEAARGAAVRPQVAVSRLTGTAVDQLLGFVETGPLFLGGGALFRAEALLLSFPGDGPARLAEDERNLRAACAALNAIGGGRTRGLGWVECALEVPPPASAGTSAPAVSRAAVRLDGVTTLALRFAARAPLHFGAGRPIGFFQPTLRHAPGSAVRGAVAFSLLERGLSADDPRFARLAAGGGVSFGSARAAGDVPSATRRKCRAAGHVFDDLVGELVRREAARRGLALAGRRACIHPECRAAKLLAWPWRAGARELTVRVRTRTALNRRTGTSMDRKLYSLEVLEPVVGATEPEEGMDLALTASLRGLDPELVSLVAALDGGDLWLGGKRSKGLGRCRLTLAPEAAADAGGAMALARGLAAAVAEAWDALGAAAGGPLVPFLPAGELPLAIALDEPWCPDGVLGEPGDALARGPLADLASPADGAPGLRLVDAFVSFADEGRFGANEARRYGAGADLTGERPPRLAAAPGSTYVYAVPAGVLAARLPAWLDLGRLGSGLDRELGWGRFRVRGAEPDA